MNFLHTLPSQNFNSILIVFTAQRPNIQYFDVSDRLFCQFTDNGTQAFQVLELKLEKVEHYMILHVTGSTLYSL